MMALQTAAWPTLVSNLAAGWSLCGEFAVRAIDRPERSAATIRRWAERIVAEPPTVLLGHPLKWRKFLWLKSLTLTLMQELLRRVEGDPAAEALWLALVPPESDAAAINGLERALSSARFPYRVYGARERDIEPADLRAIAIEGLLTAYAGLGQMYAAPVPNRINLQSRHALGLDRLPDGRWDWPKTHAGNIRRALAKFGPIEQAETLRNAGWQALGDYFEPQAAAKRSAPTLDIDGLIAAEADHLLRDISGAEPVHITPETQAAKNETRSRLIQQLKKSKGKKAARFGQALLQGETQQEAARIAGVSESQASRYQRDLEKILLNLENK